jgi:hypothetical protein
MKFKLYTNAHSSVQELGDHSNIFSGEEHSAVMKKECEEIFKTKESLLKFYFSRRDTHQLIEVGMLAEFIYRHGCKNIISLGSGPCVAEYFLQTCLPNSSQVYALDFDWFLIEKAKELFPSIVPLQFDFFNYSVSALPLNVDLAFSLYGMYVMEDYQLLGILRSLKIRKVRYMIDFHGAVLDRSLIASFRWGQFKAFVRKGLRLPDKRGKLHGFIRDKEALRGIYEKAGWKIIEERSTAHYPYIAILESSDVQCQPS